MKKFLLKFLIKIPAATLLYILLVFFANLKFSIDWLMFAIAIDIVDWFLSEAT